MSNNRKLNVFLPLLLAATLALGMFLGNKMPGAQSGGTAIFFNKGNRGTLQEVMDLIKVKYVDTLNLDKLQQEAVDGILTHLDPHSVYIPPSSLQAVNEDLEGNFEGIGVEFNISADTVNVISVLAGGPSEAAGVQTGDKIIKVSDSLVAGNAITPEKIRKVLRGPKGSKVKVTMLRQQKLVDVQITRGVIPLWSIDASYMLTPEVGYVKISKFSATTYTEFMDAMRKLEKLGMKKLVIDVRQNPGGFLDAATRVADELLDGNKLILYTEGKSYPRTDYKCQRPGMFEKGALAILTDEGSASASEILAGAIQDWDRGTIIGRRTFGKGLVQEQFDLNNGGALRLTVARYFIPSGRSIQKPYANGREAYDEDIMNRFTHGEFLNQDSIKQTDTVPYKTGNGRKVYGGGGITPDIFMPYDTTRFSGILPALYARNTFGNFIYKYYSEHLNDFKRFKTPEDFRKQYQLDNSIYNAFKTFAQADSIKGIDRITAKEEAEIKTRIKALFARQLWRNEGFYEVMNETDPMVERAVKEVQKREE